jgi:hypothetical protein
MLVRILPWDSEDSHNTLKKVTLDYRSAILSSSLIEKLDLQVETNLILNWPHGLHRSLISCNIHSNEEFFFQKSSSSTIKYAESETHISKEKELYTGQKHNVHPDNMHSSFCTKCVSNTSNISFSDAVGVPKILYSDIVSKVYKDPQNVKESWGIIHRVTGPPIIAESVYLRILDVNENSSQSKKNETKFTSVDSIQRRVQLWETFDFINTPSMSLLLHDILVGNLIFQNEELYIILMNMNVKFRVESIQPFSAGRTQVEQCDQCCTQYPTPVRIMPQTEITVKCALHNDSNILLQPISPGSHVGLARYFNKRFFVILFLHYIDWVDVLQ